MTPTTSSNVPSASISLPTQDIQLTLLWPALLYSSTATRSHSTCRYRDRAQTQTQPQSQSQTRNRAQARPDRHSDTGRQRYRRSQGSLCHCSGAHDVYGLLPPVDLITSKHHGRRSSAAQSARDECVSAHPLVLLFALALTDKTQSSPPTAFTKEMFFVSLARLVARPRTPSAKCVSQDSPTPSP